MKCICGYEQLEDYETEDGKAVGDEKFVRIDCFGKAFETDKSTGSYIGEYEKVHLYGCPKCHTVQFERTW